MRAETRSPRKPGDLPRLEDMKVPGWLIVLSIFPILHMAAIAGSALWMISAFSAGKVGVLLLATYIFPLVSYRFVNLFAPLHEGYFFIDDGKYNAWLGSVKFQLVFVSFPSLEEPMKLVPGLYSIWLRLWGSKIGKNVLWPPRIDIADRTLLDIGNLVLFGHDTYLCCHFVRVDQNRPAIFVKGITIGDRVVIGGGTWVGPGVSVATDSHVPAMARLYPNEQVTPEVAVEMSKIRTRVG